MSSPVLRIEKLSVRLPSGDTPVHAVEGVDFVIHAGETFCIVGESGSGKSVTAQSLMRLLDHAEYSEDSVIQWQDQDLLSLPEMQLRHLRGKKIAIIFQEPMTSLNPVLSIAYQLAEVLKIHGHYSHARCLDLLTDVGIGDPEHVLSLYPHQLSGGMRQRVMIAMALATGPDVLIADEPTTALDVTIQAQVLNLIKSLGKSRQMGVLIITHDLAIVSNLAQTVAVMYAGQFVEISSRDEFFRQPKHPYSQRLLACLPNLQSRTQTLPMIPGQLPDLKKSFHACRFAPRCAYAWEHCHHQAPELTLLPAAEVRCHLYTTPGKSLPALSKKDSVSVFPPALNSSPVPVRPVLQVKHLNVHYPIKRGIFKRTVGFVKAVDDISFTLNKGETLALVGESGCGKTSTAFALLRLTDAATGEIRFQSHDLLSLNEKKLRPLRRYIQMIFQDPLGSLNPRMTVRDILSEGWDAQGIFLTKSKREMHLKGLIESVGLPEDSLSRYPHEFSGGQHQRIAIARAIAMQAQVIVCDEPTSALDVSVQAQILNLLKKLQQERKLSYIFISHNIPVVSYLAHQVAVMYLGKIVEVGRVEEIIEHPKHPYTQALLACVPVLSEEPQELHSPQGEIPSPAHPPIGCHFHPRCPYAMPECKLAYPEARKLSESHRVSCFLYD
jgi:peptide/nickel transport system ATP-binding protein